MRWGSQYILYLGPQFSHLGNGQNFSAILCKVLCLAIAFPCPWNTGTVPQSTTQTRVTLKSNHNPGSQDPLLVPLFWQQLSIH